MQRVVLYIIYTAAAVLVLGVLLFCVGSVQRAEELYIPAVSLAAAEEQTLDGEAIDAEAAEPEPPVFSQDEELRLPHIGEALHTGRRFNLFGTVSSSLPLKSVSAIIQERETAGRRVFFVTFDEMCAVREYRLNDASAVREKASLNERAGFETLAAGSYTLYIEASVYGSDRAFGIAQSDFDVEDSEWISLISNNFSRNYDSSLAFFGDTEKFLFRFKPTDGRDITVERDWEKKYITTVRGANKKSWTVHTEAAPLFKEAAEYLENTYIRVRGERDSGVIPLKSLVVSYNGAYVPRFITGKNYLSHHALGTAIDLNAYIDPNGNDLANRDIIKREVELLSYNGIQEKKGKKYYDFSYGGEWEELHKNVPASVLNYLIYELAFYRAGFGWGYYYETTCDAMHFSLTETPPSAHDAAEGLRKVYEYAD